MFKLISEAYDVLSDEKKRDIFDRFGEEGLKNGPPSDEPEYEGFQFHTAEQIFRDVFGQDLFGFFGNSAPFGGSSFGGSPFIFGSLFGGFDPLFPSNFDSSFGFSTIENEFPSISSSTSSWSTSSTSSFGGRNMTSTTTSSTTKIVNGKPVVVTQTVTTQNGVTTLIQDGLVSDEQIGRKPLTHHNKRNPNPINPRNRIAKRPQNMPDERGKTKKR